MRKFFMAIVICLVCTITCCTKNEEKIEIGELISIRNAYEKEYNLISMEVESVKVLREIEMTLDGEIKTPIDIDKITRQQTLKDSIEIFVQGDQIILKKYEPCCIFCGESKDVDTFKNKSICKSCKKQLA